LLHRIRKGTVTPIAVLVLTIGMVLSPIAGMSITSTIPRSHYLVAEQSCGYIRDCNLVNQGPWHWQSLVQATYATGSATPGHLFQNDNPGDCCRARFGQALNVPSGTYFFQLVSNTQPIGPCFGSGDNAAFANSINNNIACSGNLSWIRSPAPAKYPEGYSTWTSSSFQQSGQFYFEFGGTGGAYYSVGLYSLRQLGGATAEQSCGYIRDCNFADEGPWLWQSLAIVQPATNAAATGYLVQHGGSGDCCRARFGQALNVPSGTYFFQLVSNTQPIGPCFGSGDNAAFANSINNNIACSGNLSWIRSPAPAKYPEGYSTWTSSSFQQSGQFYFEFGGTGGTYYSVGLYGSTGISSTPPNSTRCLEYNIKAQRRASIKVILPSNKPVPWSGTVATFCDADPQATWQSYDASVVWNGPDMAPSVSTARIQLLGDGRYAVVSDHTLYSMGDVKATVIVRKHMRAGEAGQVPTSVTYGVTPATVRLDARLLQANDARESQQLIAVTQNIVTDVPTDAHLLAEGTSDGLRTWQAWLDRRNGADGGLDRRADANLVAHGDDPWYAVGFFNALETPTANSATPLKNLLSVGGNGFSAPGVRNALARAVVAALVSGKANLYFLHDLANAVANSTDVSTDVAPRAPDSLMGRIEHGLIRNVRAADNLLWTLPANMLPGNGARYSLDLKEIATTVMINHLSVYAQEVSDIQRGDARNPNAWAILQLAVQTRPGDRVPYTLARIEKDLGVWVATTMPTPLVAWACSHTTPCQADESHAQSWTLQTRLVAGAIATAIAGYITDQASMTTIRNNLIAGAAFWAAGISVVRAAALVAIVTATAVAPEIVGPVVVALGLLAVVVPLFLPLTADTNGALSANNDGQRKNAAKNLAMVLVQRRVLSDCRHYPHCTVVAPLHDKAQEARLVVAVACDGDPHDFGCDRGGELKRDTYVLWGQVRGQPHPPALLGVRTIFIGFGW